MPLFESLDAIAIAQPSAANRRAVASFAAGAERYLNRGLRPLAGYSPYPGDREANTETWFDDNGWWGIAFVERLPRDRHAPLPRRRRTRAALRREPPAGTPTAAASGGTPSTRTSPGRRWPPTRCSQRSSTSKTTRRSRSRRRDRFISWANTGGFSAAEGLYADSSLSSDAGRLHRGAADLRAGAALPSHRARRGLRTRPAAEGHGAAALRLPARLLATVRRDLPAVDARAVLARRRPYAVPARGRQRARRADARAPTAKACTCSPGTARRCPPSDAEPGMLQTQAATTSLFAWLAVYPPPAS